jgi:hypothetical protein
MKPGKNMLYLGLAFESDHPLCSFQRSLFKQNRMNAITV